MILSLEVQRLPWSPMFVPSCMLNTLMELKASARIIACFFHLHETITAVFTCTISFQIKVGAKLKGNLKEPECKVHLIYLLRLLFKTVDVEGLLCQFLFLWLMNQLFICFNCKPVSCTNLALSSSWKRYKWIECQCYICKQFTHQRFSKQFQLVCYMLYLIYVLNTFDRFVSLLLILRKSFHIHICLPLDFPLGYCEPSVISNNDCRCTDTKQVSKIYIWVKTQNLFTTLDTYCRIWPFGVWLPPSF